MRTISLGNLRKASHQHFKYTSSTAITSAYKIGQAIQSANEITIADSFTATTYIAFRVTINIGDSSRIRVSSSICVGRLGCVSLLEDLSMMV